MINEKKILRYIDLGFYLVVLPLIILLLPMNRLMMYDKHFLGAVLIYFCASYYINKRANIPVLLFKKCFSKALIAVGLLVGMTLLLYVIPLGQNAMTQDIDLEVQERIRVFTIWLIFAISLTVGLMTGMAAELYRQIIKRQAIESEKSKAELAAYKSQINPHFLFNTLNTLYSLVLSHSQKTEEVFIKFTDTLKYIYSDANADTLPLERELDYIKNYIELQRLRLSSRTKVEFRSQIDDMSVQIAPMIFITFIENAFKYGISASENSEIFIDLQLKNKQLTFTTSNTIFAPPIADSTGIGINNTRKRLQLLYPKEHHLQIDKTNNTFNVELSIRL